MPTRWVGIDEAGYGPNLGPLVMSAVVAESPDDRPPDLWADLPDTLCRAGGNAELLWVDDSKALYRARTGRDRLDAACLATLAAVVGEAPGTFGGLLDAVGAGTLVDAELSQWLEDSGDPTIPGESSRARCDHARSIRAFEGAPWRIVAIRSVVVGPSRFNAGLDQHASKAKVHFAAFARLIGPLWDEASECMVTHVRGDKHGGRHYYYEPLIEVFPDAWIDRGAEGPGLSRYTMRDPLRRLELSLRPRADADDGLVALASVVSKSIREFWMDAFNAHWTSRLPGLRPTAGYPGDSARFRQAIEPLCRERGLHPNAWWRAK